LPEEFDELSPKEELYYQKPPFSTNEVFLGSKGGVSQLVDHGPTGVRQGYKGDRIYTIHGGKQTLDLTKEQNKWFNKTHKNNPNSRFYKKNWHDLGGKKADLLDSYFNELAREKPPKGYITTKEFSKKYDFPIYEKRQYGPVTKAESNFINNTLMKQLEPGKKHILTKNFLTETLEPRLFETLLDLGDGRKTVKKVNYVKDDAKLAKKVRTYLDSPFVQVKTRENMVSILKNNEIKTLFNKGDYKGLVKALRSVKGLTNAERANALLRITQAMSGVKFRDFEHNLKLNKPSANKIFSGLEKAKWGDPYADAYRNLKRNTIKNAIGDEYFTKSYGGFLEDTRKVLRNAGMDPTILKLDLNEITGLSAGYKNKTFSSTQFVNFMDSKFNQEQHASMIKEYGRHEAKLQSALKGKNPSEARQVVKDWEIWRKGWYNRLDDKFKTKAIRDILPTFTLGKDPYAKVLSKKRLSELAGLDFNIREEGIKAEYGKTFKSIKTQPILKEVATGVDKAVAKILSDNGFTCKLQGGLTCNDPRAYIKSINEQKALSLAGDAKAASKFNKVSKAVRAARGISKFTAWGILGEVAFAPIIALPMLAKGESWSRIMNDISFGLYGENEQEELKRFAGKAGTQRLEALEAGEKIDALAEREFPKARIGMDSKRVETAQKKVKEEAYLDLMNKITPFMQGPRNEYFNQEAFIKAGGDLEAAEEAIFQEKLGRKGSSTFFQDRLDPTEEMVGFNSGGLTRTVAPDSGPVSRGLRSLYIDDMD